ncbi:MAG: glycosyltransferase family 39 protein, partial [Anaerolineae bacterium]|nr:glycosyltransferase family 39 protein [Anaerolineae bacterium]
MGHSMIPPARKNSAPPVPQNWARLAVMVLLLVILASLQLAPSVSNQGRDSGIFAYTGRVIHDGGRPYIDAWDNKLPGVYFIDALAFAIFGTNRWALWFVENLALFSTTLVLCWLLRQRYGQDKVVWIGSLILILLSRHPALLNDTNYTEPYALLPQMIVLAAGFQMLRDPRPRWAFIIGFASGVALLFKQTTIGVAAAFVPAILLSRHPILREEKRWRWLSHIVIGGLMSLLPVLLYLLAYGILDDAFDASFVMARSFHAWVGEESVWIGRTLVSTFTASAFPLVYGPLLPFIGFGIYTAWNQSRPHPRATSEDKTNATLAIWVVLMFFVDLTLANITNRGHGHYYVPLLPSV